MLGLFSLQSWDIDSVRFHTMQQKGVTHSRELRTSKVNVNVHMIFLFEFYAPFWS